MNRNSKQHFPYEKRDVSNGIAIEVPGNGCGRSPRQLGVPFGCGEVYDGAQVRLHSKPGNLIKTQTREMLRWPDGSIKWMLLDWVSEPGEFHLHIDSDATSETHEESTAPDSASDESNDSDEHSTIESGIIVGERPGELFRIGDVKIGFACEIEDEGACGLTANLVKYEHTDEGPVRTSVRAQGTISEPGETSKLEVIAHLHFYRDLNLLRLELTVRNPRAALHPGGIWELGDPNSVFLRSARTSFSHRKMKKSAFANRKVLAQLIGARETVEAERGVFVSQQGSGGANYDSPIHKDKNGDVHTKRPGTWVRVDDQESDMNRAEPIVCINEHNGPSLGVYLEDFWQNFPTQLEGSTQRINADLFPSQDDVLIELQPGEQKTHVMWAAWGCDNQIMAHLESVRYIEPIRLPSSWTCGTHVIPWLEKWGAGNTQHYHALIGAAVDGENSFNAKCEAIDEYGWRNFGDIYGDHESARSNPDEVVVSQYNNQYDMILGFQIQYFRGGDKKWFDMMRRLARHVIDIDLYHTNEDCLAYNKGMFWHTAHYVDAGLSTHRAYPTGTCGGGPSSGHAYSRGLLIYYCITGDENAREAVKDMGDWMIAAEDGRGTKYRWFAGGETGLTSASGTEVYHGPGRGPGNAVEVLVTAFELTLDRKYIDQAERIIRRVVHPDQDLEELDLLDAEWKWFYNLFLQSLGRYLEVKHQMGEYDQMYSYAQRCLVRFAEWMEIHEYLYLDQSDKLEFPTETWAAQEMRKVEVFQWAARHSTGEIRTRYLEQAAYFFDNSCRQLMDFDSRSYCRPIALLLTSGYSRAWFELGGLDSIKSVPKGEAFEFERHQVFLSQKTRAIRRAKWAGLGGASFLIVLLLAVAWQLFR